MIDRPHVLMMAQYNAWQNKQIMNIVKLMDEAALHVDHKAFFGSIMATLNHILWADTVWMSRWCDDVPAPAKGTAPGTEFTETLGVWQAERFHMDGRIRIWAETLSNFDLIGDLTWYSGTMEADITQPKALCITHMFNHQTHHRGQVHAMLTASGSTAPVTDLCFMPQDA